jgi:hypothetical protein
MLYFANGGLRMKNDDQKIPLLEAFKLLRTEWPHFSPTAIRRALLAGKIPHERTSEMKNARFLVSLNALREWRKTLQR